MECENASKDRLYTIEELEELLDSIPYEVWIKDENSRHRYINKCCAERMGYTKEEIIGKTDYEFRPKGMAESCIEGDKKILKSKTGILTEDKINIDGHEKWYEIYKFLISEHNSSSKLLAGIAKEITADKNIQKGMIKSSLAFLDKNEGESEDLSSLALDILEELKIRLGVSGIFTYLYDEDAKFLKADLQVGEKPEIAKFYEIYNLPDEKKAKLLSDNEYEKLRKMKDLRKLDIYEKMDVSMEKGSLAVFAIKYSENLVGTLNIYYNENNPQKYIQEDFIKYTCMTLGMMAKNLVLKKQLNEELRIRKETQKKLEMVLDTATDLYAFVKQIDGKTKWIEVSENTTQIIGWTKDDLLNKEAIDLIHFDDREKLITAMKKSRETGEGKNFIVRVLCKDGGFRVIDLNWRFINEDYMCVITANDLTEKMNLKEEKKSLQEAIEIESLKTEFFANISHEFKTPLNIIITTVQLLMSKMKGNWNSYPFDYMEKYIKGIKQNSYRLLRLSNNIIDITKIDGGYYELELGNYNIVSVIEDMVSSVVDYISVNKKSITFDTTEEEIIIACDPEKIERVILNLLSNALKHTAENGKIFIGISKTKEKVIISVKNNGSPILESDRNKIFERFTQSEDLLTRKCEGSGIGLSLVKSLVELHKGRIYLNVENKKETEFVIELPIRTVAENKDSRRADKRLPCTIETCNIEFSDIYCK